MNRRTKGVLLATGLAVAAAVTSVDLLTEALARGKGGPDMSSLSPAASASVL